MGEMRWIPQINANRCDGCGICISLCPTHTLGIVAQVAVVVQPECCSYCGKCETNCPTHAIELPYLIERVGMMGSQNPTAIRGATYEQEQ